MNSVINLFISHHSDMFDQAFWWLYRFCITLNVNQSISLTQNFRWTFVHPCVSMTMIPGRWCIQNKGQNTEAQKMIMYKWEIWNFFSFLRVQDYILKTITERLDSAALYKGTLTSLTLSLSLSLSLSEVANQPLTLFINLTGCCWKCKWWQCFLDCLQCRYHLQKSY